MFAFLGKEEAGENTPWDHTEEEKSLKPQRCPMLQPMLCPGEDVCHSVEHVRSGCSTGSVLTRNFVPF
jgi:hypothetical protein